MRTTQFYTETNNNCSRKSYKNLACVGQAVQLAVSSISGRTTWTWNFSASVASDVTVVAGPRRLAEGDVEYSTIPPVFFVCINGNNDVLVLGSPCLKMREKS